MQVNVVPKEFTATFDIRLRPGDDPDEFEAVVKRWCEEVGPGVSYSFLQKNPKIMGTKIDDSNPFWMAFINVLSKINEYKLHVLAGTTDARFLRQVSQRYYIRTFWQRAIVIHDSCTCIHC